VRYMLRCLARIIFISKTGTNTQCAARVCERDTKNAMWLWKQEKERETERGRARRAASVAINSRKQHRRKVKSVDRVQLKGSKHASKNCWLYCWTTTTSAVRSCVAVLSSGKQSTASCSLAIHCSPTDTRPIQPAPCWNVDHAMHLSA